MRRIAIGLILSTLAFVVGAEETEQQGADDQGEKLREEIHVVANDGATGAPIGASATTIDREDAVGNPVAVADLVATVPGVARNGQGGLFQVVSIRGVSRQRVLSTISGARISSERRAGVSTSFIDPQLLGSVEVVRGPATTLYGSGALGGVVQAFPRRFDGPAAHFGYETNGNASYLAGGTSVGRWSFGLAHRRAEDGEAADGTRLFSRFEQTSGIAERRWSQGKLQHRVSMLASRGDDLGKANSDFPERTTLYPRERHGLVQWQLGSSGGWRVDTFVHAQDLRTEVVDQGDLTNSRVDNESVDFGVRFDADRAVTSEIEVRYGAETNGRRNVDAEEIRIDLDPVAPEPPRTGSSLSNASSDEAGVFAQVRWIPGPVSLEAGARFAWIRQSNEGFGSRDDSAWNGHLGLSVPIGKNARFDAGLHSGLRFPSLTELFFTGTTGRGEVLGNPELDPERSVGTEGTFRWVGRRLFARGSWFYTNIDSYIDRIRITPDLRTFRNVASGTIQGVEIDVLFMPTARWKLRLGGQQMRGREDSGAALSDIPPDEVMLGMGYERKHWRVDSRLVFRGAKNDPGTDELPLASAELFSASFAYRVARSWSLSLNATNLLDQDFRTTADDKSTLAPGRSVALHVGWVEGG